MPQQKVVVVTDSVACLTGDLIQQYGIRVVPLNIISEGKAYRDGIDLTPNQAYELFQKSPDTFSTSAPSPTVFLDTYRCAAADAENILVVTLSSKLSSTYNDAVIAKEMAARELPGTCIEIVDSFTATAAEGFIAVAAARAAQSGAGLDQCLGAANDIKSRVNCYVLLDTIKHVYRSGRVPRLAAQAGGLLGIRVLFHLNGVVHLSGLARNREQGIKMILSRIKENVGNRPIFTAVSHAYAAGAAEQLKARLQSEFRCTATWMTEFSPLMGYACGTGTLAVAFYPEE